MPNEPEHAARRRSPPVRPRKNGQDDTEGSPHRPEEFDSLNPAKLPEHPIRNVDGVQEEGFYGSQAWEATSSAEQAEEGGPTAPDVKRDVQKRLREPTYKNAREPKEK